MRELKQIFRYTRSWWRRDICSPSLCMMMSVCDEADYLLDHLLYHRFLGVTRAYIFLDHCTDNTRELLKTLPWVIVVDCDRDQELEHLTTHQNRCASIALHLALREGFEWLIHIDPDEYAWGNVDNEGLNTGSLVEMLHKVKSDTELVWLRTKEAVPIRSIGSDELWAQEYFQEQPHVLQRPMLDPITGKIQQLNKWIGHTLGKSIVRVKPNVIPLSAHAWGKRDHSGERALLQENLGFHYHFVVANARHWHRKYLKLSWESDTWEAGNPVPFPKQAWKEVSCRMSPDAANDYFDKWIAIPDKQAKRLVQQGELIHEKHVSTTMKRVRQDPAIKFERWLAQHGVPLTLSKRPWKRSLKSPVDCHNSNKVTQ